MKFVILWILFLWACAHMEAPKGGPKDKYAPYVVGVYPKSKQTQVKRDFHGIVQFNEWIHDRVSLTHVQISPPLKRPLKVETDGPYLHIYSRDLLDTNTTYSILVSRDIKDLRSNKLRRPFQILFSTGSNIDSLELKGSVDLFDSYKASKPQATIALYPMSLNRYNFQHLKDLYDSNGVLDTIPLLLQERPLYATQSDTAGLFQFKGLAPGKYRLLAFLDKNKNRIPDIKTEKIAIAKSDILLKDSLAPQSLTLANLDTSGFYPRGLDILTDARLAIKFNRPPFQPESLVSKDFTIQLEDTNSTWNINPGLYYWDKQTEQMVIQSDSLTRDSTYLLTIPESLKDSSQIVLDSGRNKLIFSYLPLPDTNDYPQLEGSYPKNYAKHINPQDSILLHFDRRINPQELINKILFRVNGDTLKYSLSQESPFTLKLQPLIELQPNAKVQIAFSTLDTISDSLNLDPSLESNSSDRLKIDTLYESWLKFDTWENMKLSGIQGQLPGCENHLKVRLLSIKSKKVFRTNCQDSSFYFSSLPEGHYFLDAYEDLDSNGLWNPGSIIPFQFSEPFYRLADTLKLERGRIHSLDSLLLKETHE